MTTTKTPWTLSEGGNEKDGSYEACIHNGDVTIANIPGESSYARDDARLLFAAPRLREALKFLLEAAETEPGMMIYKAHLALARSVIAATPET